MLYSCIETLVVILNFVSKLSCICPHVTSELYVLDHKLIETLNLFFMSTQAVDVRHFIFGDTLYMFLLVINLA